MFIVQSFATPFLTQKKLEEIRRIPGLTWKAGINPRMASMTEAEIKARLMPITKIPATAPRAESRVLGDIPESFDSRTVWPGSVGPVRDQASCGSCWSFSAIGDFGARRVVAGLDKQFVQYSEEYPVACDSKDMGCNGGSILYVHMFLKNTGVPTDACVSYKSGDGNTKACPLTCDDGSEIKLVKAKGYRVMETIDDMYDELSKRGPIQGEFFVFEDFQYYESGIYQHETGKLLGGHGILIVGWGVEDGTPYWIIRNSWGPDWGEDGYFRILRGSNECLIESASAAATF